MNTNDEKNPAGTLGKYTQQIRPAYPALVKTEQAPAHVPGDQDESDDADESRYRALVEHREKKGSAPRFRIVTRTGQSHGCGYAYLLGWLHSPPDTLSIYTTTHIFVLTGKNLQRVENALMRDKVKQLREFNKEQDTIPAADDPIITHLEVTSRF